ncbi:MAG: gas vesicle protein [Methanophagales archaeon]|nr:gas vesicle protein [Methanophagales archaeon]
MRLKEVIEKVKIGIGELTTLKLNTVIGASKDEENGGWKVLVELLEKESIPDSMDLLGIYEVLLNQEGEIVRFERKGMRKRGDIEKVEVY